MPFSTNLTPVQDLTSVQGYDGSRRELNVREGGGGAVTQLQVGGAQSQLDVGVGRGGIARQLNVGERGGGRTTTQQLDVGVG